uniref:Integrase catalytic domain-containing protein n=1 Tax=Trichuris muris TaxID=70415 RepID=A0A5S6Q6G7_TRIMR
MSDVSEKVIKTESSAVLCWIRATCKRFSAFEENRITDILDGFDASQWSHVPGDENPADNLTHGLSVASLAAGNRWINGPSFLHLEAHCWPKEEWRVSPANDTLEEAVIARAVAEVPENVVLNLINRYSNYDRLLRIMMYVEKFIRRCRKLITSEDISVTPDSTWVWKHCIRAVKGMCFGNGQRLLHDCGKVLVSSRLFRLKPFLSSDGLIRVGGRLDQSSLAFYARHPLILPSKHALTILFIRRTHERHFHAGVETTLSLTSAIVWILNGRQVIDRCVICRRYRSRSPGIPKTPLLECRVNRPAVPFTHLGLYCFGPILVSVRRSQEKRRVTIFTCLASRALHFEVCLSLDVNSFLYAFRRFTSRRGTPTECYSDNGKNFIAGHRALIDGSLRLDATPITSHMTGNRVKWNFNPPEVPHFGGAWERLIRSAKLALRTTLHGQRITDEVLHTVVVEIENIMNRRPHSNVPVDLITRQDLNSRKQWFVAQAVLDRFWRKWMREYVPTLICGPKEIVQKAAMAGAADVEVFFAKAHKDERKAIKRLTSFVTKSTFSKNEEDLKKKEQFIITLGSFLAKQKLADELKETIELAIL